jgi:hypothetical protein
LWICSSCSWSWVWVSTCLVPLINEFHWGTEGLLNFPPSFAS